MGREVGVEGAAEPRPGSDDGGGGGISFFSTKSLRSGVLAKPDVSNFQGANVSRFILP